jgi:hypothetical protein
MTISVVLSQIDIEISRLQQARKLLAGSDVGNGRATKPHRKKRTISAAGRARIAAAQRARWAKVKKKTAK